MEDTNEQTNLSPKAKVLQTAKVRRSYKLIAYFKASALSFFFSANRSSWLISLSLSLSLSLGSAEEISNAREPGGAERLFPGPRHQQKIRRQDFAHIGRAQSFGKEKKKKGTILGTPKKFNTYIYV